MGNQNERRIKREGHVRENLTTSDMEDQARAIDILDAQMGCFLQAEAAGVDRGEASPVAGKSDSVEDLPDLVDAEDGRKLLLARGTNQGEGGEVSVEGRWKKNLMAQMAMVEELRE